MGIDFVVDRLVACERLPRQLACVVLALAVGGCATVPELDAPGYDRLLTLAQASDDAGQSRAALEGYQRAAAADSARKEPWQAIAQLQLAARQPELALAAAEETLRRDPADAIAREVSATSSLELAVQALQRLNAAGSLPSVNTRARARELATLMANVFGADTLIPEGLTEQYVRGAEQRCKAAQAKQLAIPTPDPPPDPFKNLGGG